MTTPGTKKKKERKRQLHLEPPVRRACSKRNEVYECLSPFVPHNRALTLARQHGYKQLTDRDQNEEVEVDGEDSRVVGHEQATPLLIVLIADPF